MRRIFSGWAIGLALAVGTAGAEELPGPDGFLCRGTAVRSPDGTEITANPDATPCVDAADETGPGIQEMIDLGGGYSVFVETDMLSASTAFDDATEGRTVAQGLGAVGRTRMFFFEGETLLFSIATDGASGLAEAIAETDVTGTPECSVRHESRVAELIFFRPESGRISVRPPFAGQPVNVPIPGVGLLRVNWVRTSTTTLPEGGTHEDVSVRAIWLQTDDADMDLVLGGARAGVDCP